MNKKQTEVLIALATIAINNKEGFTVNAKTLQPHPLYAARYRPYRASQILENCEQK